MAQPSFSNLIKHWHLNQKITFLNHGSFGACPVQVLEKQGEYRRRMEEDPVKFMVRELEELIWESKQALADFIYTKSEDLVFVPNATHGVNTVLNSVVLNAGDELLVTNHGYGACLNAAKWYCEQQKANLVVAEVPFPITAPEEVTASVMKMVSTKTKLVLIDHITSPTGIIFPVKEIVAELNERGIDCLIDGAHAPGMVNLDLSELGAAYYTGNCHKWICSPKGSAFLQVRKDKQHLIHPLSISHDYDVPHVIDKLWSSQFLWPGTSDYSAFLCVKDAIDFMGQLHGGGWEQLRTVNRSLVLEARKLIAESLNSTLPAPDEMIGSLADIFLTEATLPPFGFNYLHPIQNRLWEEYGIEVPVFIWNKKHPKLWVRISAQCYNSLSQYQYLADSLAEITR